MMGMLLVLDDAGTEPDAKITIPPPQVRIASRRRQAAAMEGSTIAEGGKSRSAGRLTRTMGRRATVSPVEKYELDGYDKVGGTALLLCSPKLHFFTDVNV